jgi:hypothetical protein
MEFVWLKRFDDCLLFIHENGKLMIVGQMEKSLLATIFGVAKSCDTVQDATHQNIVVDKFPQADVEVECFFIQVDAEQVLRQMTGQLISLFVNRIATISIFWAVVSRFVSFDGFEICLFRCIFV